MGVLILMEHTFQSLVLLLRRGGSINLYLAGDDSQPTKLRGDSKTEIRAFDIEYMQMTLIDLAIRHGATIKTKDFKVVESNNDGRSN